MTAGALGQANRLKVISRFGVGTDSVDIGAATQAGIVVTITPGANSVAVAELTIGLMLALARQIPYHDRVVRNRQWTRVQGIELSGALLGIVGYGRIGKEVAATRGRSGDARPVLRSCRTHERAGRVVPARRVTRPSDVVSLHLPLTEATRNLIDTARAGPHETVRVSW